MRVIELREQFGLDRLTLGERPIPEPAGGEIQLRMRAAALNYRDLLMVRGHYDPKQSLPLIPCSDGVGEVLAVGPGVCRFAVGDRVCPLFASRWIDGPPHGEIFRSTLGGPLDGTLAEVVVASEQAAVAVPEHLTDAEAACLPCAGVTAWNALVTHGSIRPGDTVLIQGTGGVAIFALQFSRLLGARAIVLSSSDAKLERARELGAAATINYREVPRWGREVRQRHGAVDLVVEVGGAGTLSESLRAVRPGGRIALIGVLAGGAAPNFDVVPILMRQIRVQGVFVGHRASFEAMNRAIGMHEMHPVVSRTFDLGKTRQALDWLSRGEHFGKIVIDLASGSG